MSLVPEPLRRDVPLLQLDCTLPLVGVVLFPLVAHFVLLEFDSPRLLVLLGAVLSSAQQQSLLLGELLLPFVEQQLPLARCLLLLVVAQLFDEASFLVGLLEFKLLLFLACLVSFLLLVACSDRVVLFKEAPLLFSILALHFLLFLVVARLAHHLLQVAQLLLALHRLLRLVQLDLSLVEVAQVFLAVAVFVASPEGLLAAERREK